MAVFAVPALFCIAARKKAEWAEGNRPCAGIEEEKKSVVHCILHFCEYAGGTSGRNIMKYWLPKTMILLMVIYAYICMWHWPIGFTFFTQLSNLYAAVAVLLQLIAGPGRLKGFKYSAVVSILVTFVVYLLVLAPIYPGGILAAYRQDHDASLCMHVLVPMMMLADFCLNDRPVQLHRRWLLYALLPPTVWFCMILILGAAGFRWHGMPAPYPFLNYRAPSGWFGFMPETAGYGSMGIGVAYALVVMLGVFALIGFLILRIGSRPKDSTNR